MNKICSEFVHPTAWSLFTADIGSERFPEARGVFYGCGAQYFAAVFAEIAPTSGDGRSDISRRSRLSVFQFNHPIWPTSSDAFA
jgi:hypothetical protein